MNDEHQNSKKRTVSHSVMLKAVNHPIRRKMLEIVNENNFIKKDDFLKRLIEDDIIADEGTFDYNTNFLIQAQCIIAHQDDNSDEISYEITRAGKVIEHYE